MRRKNKTQQTNPKEKKTRPLHMQRLLLLQPTHRKQGGIPSPQKRESKTSSNKVIGRGSVTT